MSDETKWWVLVRRLFATGSWLACMVFSAHNALRQNWDAAVFFLLFPVLIELSEINGRLASIQKNTKPNSWDIGSA